MELFRHELYKIFTRKTVWIGLLFVILLVCFSSYMQDTQFTKLYGDVKEYYNDYFKGKEGPISDSLKQTTKDWLADSLNSYNYKAAARQTSVQENRTFYFYYKAASSGKFSETANDKITNLQNDQKNADTSYKSREDVLYLAMLKKIKAAGLYFTLPMDNVLIFPNGLGFVVMGILVLLGISPVFSDEYSLNMDLLILSSKKGKRNVVTAKILSTTVYCVFAAAIVLLTYFLVQAAVLGIHGLNAPLQLNNLFSNSPYPFTYGGYFGLQAGLCTVACVFFGMLVLLVSAVSSNVLIPFFVCGFLYASAAFIKTLGVPAPKVLAVFADFSYTELMRVYGLISSFKAYNVFGYPILYLNLILTIYVIITAILIYLIYRIFHCRQVN